MTPDLESMRLEPALDLRVPPKRAQRGDRAAPDDGDAEVIAEQLDCRQRLFALFAIALLDVMQFVDDQDLDPAGSEQSEDVRIKGVGARALAVGRVELPKDPHQQPSGRTGRPH